MENQIENIELINKYLDKLLSENDIKDFENRLKTDIVFNEEYKAQVRFLEGFKRLVLKKEITKAKKIYKQNKWFRYLGFIVPILVIIVSVLVYIFNIIKTKETPNEMNSSKLVLDSVIPINNFEEKIGVIDTLNPTLKLEKNINKIVSKDEIDKAETPKKLPQNFIINLEKDTILTCKEGTKLTIKANSFIDSKGRLIKGKILLEVTEYYKLSDVLLANLTTTSNGMQLETGGMLFIEAKQEKEQLILNPDKAITISFPNNKKKKDMQLFSGNWQNGTINWELETTESIKTEKIEVLKTIEEGLVEVPFSVVEDPPVFPGCENTNKTISRNCTTKEIEQFVQRNFNTQIASNLGLTGRLRINTMFKINQNGEVVDIQSRSSDPDLEDEANRVIALLPKIQPGKQRGKNVVVPYSLPIIFQAEGNMNLVAKLGGDAREQRKKQDSIYNKRVEDRLTGNDIISVTVAEVNNYIFRASKLGWINCDRFNRSTDKIKYKIKVNNSYGTRISMVFKSMYSVLPSRKMGEFYDFNNVPKNEDVILIAIKNEGEKLYLDIVETTTQENPNLNFKFKELTIIELKEQLKKLDKLF